MRRDFVGIPPSVAELRDLVIAEGAPAALARLADATARWPAASIAQEMSLNRLGFQLAAAKRPDLALAIFEEATRRFPRSANAWSSLAEALEAAGRRAEALDATVRAQALLPELPAGAMRDALAKALGEREARLRASAR